MKRCTSATACCKTPPHYAKPLRTTIPIFRWFSGLRNAPLKFLSLLDRPGERGALVIKIGLTLYDFLVRSQRVMPRHEFRLRSAALREYPQLNPAIVCAASYYDAWMPTPERICLEMLLDAEASDKNCHALNYISAIAGDRDAVTLRDQLCGAEYIVKPKVVVNAAGPWVDIVNDGLGQGGQRYIGGTKGSHLILDNPALLEAAQDSEIFFENEDGRIVLILPFFNRVMIGTTDIRIDNPDDAVTSDEEIDYLLSMVGKVFPSIKVEPSQIVFCFSAVRPLPFSQGGNAGQISRDHSINTQAANAAHSYPIHSLIGGKWTTFRAFAEQAADRVLGDLERPRLTSTKDLSIGGGRAYPRSDADRENWLHRLQLQSGLPAQRLVDLFERYGTRAENIASYISLENDGALRRHPRFSQREIEFMLKYEKVERLDDLLLRRTLIAMLGEVTRDLIDELADICTGTLNWSEERKAEEVQRAIDLLRDKHRVEL